VHTSVSVPFVAWVLDAETEGADWKSPHDTKQQG